MRTYFIFKIKKHYATLTKNKPYQVYKAIEDMYYLNQKDLLSPENIFLQMHDKFNTEILNNKIYNTYKDTYTYTKYQNTHKINDYFKDEETKLIINQRAPLIISY